MIAFNHVVPVLNLSVFSVSRGPAFAFEQSKRATIGWRFIRVDESRDLPLLHVVEDFTQKPVCSFAVTTGGEIKIDSAAPAVDFYLSSRRNSKAAYRFLGKILNNVKKWQIPRFINTDKAPAYGRALALLKREGRCPSDVEHRQIKYRNNVIECDHGKLKRIIDATLGFKSMKTAYATIKGIEVMRALRKGQASAFYYGDPLGEMRLVSRVFEM